MLPMLLLTKNQIEQIMLKVVQILDQFMRHFSTQKLDISTVTNGWLLM